MTHPPEMAGFRKTTWVQYRGRKYGWKVIEHRVPADHHTVEFEEAVDKMIGFLQEPKITYDGVAYMGAIGSPIDLDSFYEQGSIGTMSKKQR